jgi:hypothetical protein
MGGRHAGPSLTFNCLACCAWPGGPRGACSHGQVSGGAARRPWTAADGPNTMGPESLFRALVLPDGDSPGPRFLGPGGFTDDDGCSAEDAAGEEVVDIYYGEDGDPTDGVASQVSSAPCSIWARLRASGSYCRGRRHNCAICSWTTRRCRIRSRWAACNSRCSRRQGTCVAQG